MKFSVEFIERKVYETSSIENVFRQVAKGLSKMEIGSRFEKVPFGHSFIEILRNLFQYKRGKADIYHITGHIHYMALVLPVNNTVLTIHDLVILRMRKGFRRFVLKKLLFDLPVKRLKYITVISENTKRELIECTNCADAKIRVIENPIRDDFIAPKTREFDPEHPVILQVGTSPVKNLPGLTTALKGVKCSLRIIGPLDEAHVAALIQNGIDYENRVGLTDEELRDEYLNADMVVFCSTYEGFGLPIIEAQATGTPLITSNLSPMKEVAGDGALLADPHDPESIKNAVQRLIDERETRNSVVEKGRANVKRFSSPHIAECYAKLYFEILEKE
jgi:glycosyltransferase involved in cell wall biosynthesis